MWVIETLNRGDISRENASALASQMPSLGDKILVYTLATQNEIFNGVNAIGSGVTSLNRQIAIGNRIAIQSLAVQKKFGCSRRNFGYSKRNSLGIKKYKGYSQYS